MVNHQCTVIVMQVRDLHWLQVSIPQKYTLYALRESDPISL